MEDTVTAGVAEMDVHVLNDFGNLTVFRVNLYSFDSAEAFRFWADSRVYRYVRFYVAQWLALVSEVGHTVIGNQGVQALERQRFLVGYCAWPHTRSTIRWESLRNNELVSFEDYHWVLLPIGAARIYVTPGPTQPAIQQPGP